MGALEMTHKLSYDVAWVTRIVSVRDVDKIIAGIVTCDKVCLMWQYEYTQTGNKEYIEFAKNARIRYLSGIMALNLVIKRDSII